MSLATLPEPPSTDQSPRAEFASDRLSLGIRWSRVTRVLFVMVACLITANIASRLWQTTVDSESYGGLREVAFRFDMDRENTVPAWFSSLLLFSCAVALGCIWKIRQRNQGAFVWHWAVLGLAFAYLSLDESAALHEILIVPVRRRLGLSGVLYFAWVVPAAVLVGGFLLAYFRFWWQLPRGVRGRVFLAAALYLGGAMGMELVGGALADAYGLHAFAYTIVMTLEETLEMVGLIVFLSALAELIRREAPSWGLDWLPAAQGDQHAVCD